MNLRHPFIPATPFVRSKKKVDMSTSQSGPGSGRKGGGPPVVRPGLSEGLEGGGGGRRTRLSLLDDLQEEEVRVSCCHVGCSLLYAVVLSTGGSTAFTSPHAPPCPHSLTRSASVTTVYSLLVLFLNGCCFFLATSLVGIHVAPGTVAFLCLPARVGCVGGIYGVTGSYYCSEDVYPWWYTRKRRKKKRCGISCLERDR